MRPFDLPTMTISSAFPKISRIAYEGPKSKSPLAFKYYNAEEMVEGHTIHITG
jgi:xylose isomerase